MADRYSGTTQFLIILVCFIAGYALVSWIIGRLKKPSTALPTAVGQTSFDAYYRKVLGVSSTAGNDEIQAAYRHAVAQSHPDKVAHLGPEQAEAAGRRTMELNEAYQYFRRTYRF